jgi:hypothetical protein
MAAKYEYKVEHMREALVGDKIDTGDLEDLLNDRASDGWRVIGVEAAQVKGRVGPGSVPGLVVVFEREKS